MSTEVAGGQFISVILLVSVALCAMAIVGRFLAGQLVCYVLLLPAGGVVVTHARVPYKMRARHDVGCDSWITDGNSLVA